MFHEADNYLIQSYLLDYQSLVLIHKGLVTTRLGIVAVRRSLLLYDD